MRVADLGERGEAKKRIMDKEQTRKKKKQVPGGHLAERKQGLLGKKVGAKKGETSKKQPW